MKTVGRVGLSFPMLTLEETTCKLLMSDGLLMSDLWLSGCSIKRRVKPVLCHLEHIP